MKDDLEEYGWDANHSRIPVAKSRTPNDRPIANQMTNESISSQITTQSYNGMDNSPGKENFPLVDSDFKLKNSFVQTSNVKPQKNDCNHYLDANKAIDISFSDDTKSEAFFRDIMLSSQQMPISQNTFSLSPKPIAQKRNSLKTVANTGFSLAISPSIKSAIIPEYSNQIKFSKCNLSPIERVNSDLNVINDIDLDLTLKSLQFDKTLTPSKIPYPSETNQNKCFAGLEEANYTPPAPIQPPFHHQTMPTLANQHKSPIRRSLSSDPPPLPPKAKHLIQNHIPLPPPRPRPPSGKHHYLVGINQNDNNLMRNIDQITDKSNKSNKSNISFV
jgi:hypothetical protein